MPHYLLPCSTCGRKVPVQPSEAGKTVPCQCGATLDVPSLRKVLRLPPVERSTAVQTSSRAWTAANRLWLAGAIIVLASLVASVLLYIAWPSPPPDLSRAMAEQTAGLTPLESLQLWEMLRHGLNRLPQSGQRERYAQAVMPLKVLSAAIAVMAAGGIALIILGRWTRKRESSGHAS